MAVGTLERSIEAGKTENYYGGGFATWPSLPLKFTGGCHANQRTACKYQGQIFHDRACKCFHNSKSDISKILF